MPDDKNPVEKALDLCVYAPVGAALYVRDMLPGMMGIFVMRGKRELSGKKTPAPPMPPPVPADEVKRRIDESVGVAKVVAESGFGVAKDVAGAGIGVARDVAGTALKGLLENRPGTPRPNGTAPTAAPSAAAPAPPTAAGPTPTAAPAPAPAPEPAPAPSASAPTESADLTVPGVDELAIPDYDELSASQVVERLEGLGADELEAVRRYEAAHRGRNTILGKIAQLG
ncbi:MAG: hypothetical protein U0W40_20395 [Acidimicrobiia bacterium]